MQSIEKEVVIISKSFSDSVLLRKRAKELFPKAKFYENADYSNSNFLKDLSQSEGAIVGLTKVNLDFLSHAPQLKAVSKFGVGTDNIDFQACEEGSITICQKEGINKRAVSEYTLGLMIGITRNLFKNNDQLKKGIWKKNGGVELSELTIGIVGLGNIGKDLAKLLSVFGSRILAHDILVDEKFCHQFQIQMVAKNDLLERSDIISLHLPLKEDTRYFLSEEEFNRVQPHTWVVNTSRGNIINEEALITALDQKKLAGVALDVFWQEPYSNSSLLSRENVILTPHSAGTSRKAVNALGLSALEGLAEFLAGGGPIQ